MESNNYNSAGRKQGKDISHRLKEIDENFIKNGGCFAEVKIGDIFNFYTGDTDIQGKHINGLGEYVITSGLSNYGILGKTDIKAKIFKKNTITVDMFGNAFLRDFSYKIVTHARVFVMDLKQELNIMINNRIGIYLVGLLKYLNQIYRYDDMCSPAKIKNNVIVLPYINNKIAFSYMEERIRELEQERIRELEAYLIATGLNGCDLNENDTGGGETRLTIFFLMILNLKNLKLGSCLILNQR